MKTTTILLGLTLAGASSANDAARGQLFGERNVGSSISRRPGQGSPSRLERGGRLWETGSAAGAATGETDIGARVKERFMRGARGAGDFVGTDAQERRAFVGSQQSDTTGPVQSAQEGLRIEQGPDANQGQAKTATTSPAGMYDPRLRVSFDFSRPPAAEVSSRLAWRLEQSSAIRRLGRIEVLLEGETATLRGVVASERDRSLARLLVLFEPGISEVKNELVVTAAPPLPTLRHPTLRHPAVRPGAADTPSATREEPSRRREF